MRKLLATLLLVPTLASAQVLYLNNKGGGEIVLTTRDCVHQGKKYDNVKHAYSWTPEIGKLDGCWTVVDGNVHMIYFADGSIRVYPLDNFRRRD